MEHKPFAKNFGESMDIRAAMGMVWRDANIKGKGKGDFFDIETADPQVRAILTPLMVKSVEAHWKIVGHHKKDTWVDKVYQHAFYEYQPDVGMNQYSMVTPEADARFTKRYKHWVGERNPANMFHDGRTLAKYAILEFLANAEGMTYYESAVGKPIKSKGDENAEL